MANYTLEYTLRIIPELYGCLSDEQIAAWSLEEAQKVVDELHRYEIENGYTPLAYSAALIYELIAEYIEEFADEDAEEDD